MNHLQFRKQLSKISNQFSKLYFQLPRQNDSCNNVSNFHNKMIFPRYNLSADQIRLDWVKLDQKAGLANWISKLCFQLPRQNDHIEVLDYINLHLQSNLCTAATLGTLKLRPLLTGGRCSQIEYIIKFKIEPFKWWPLQAGGRYSEVAVNSGLTVFGIDQIGLDLIRLDQIGLDWISKLCFQLPRQNDHPEEPSSLRS